MAKLGLFLVDKYHMKLVEVSMKEKSRVAMFGAAVIIGTKNRGTRDSNSNEHYKSGIEKIRIRVGSIL